MAISKIDEWSAVKKSCLVNEIYFSRMYSEDAKNKQIELSENSQKNNKKQIVEGRLLKPKRGSILVY